MFEMLLQADRALASGALDQAERSYWQLVELDPTNAIAVIGLARVSLERGDHAAGPHLRRAGPDDGPGQRRGKADPRDADHRRRRRAARGRRTCRFWPRSDLRRWAAGGFGQPANGRLCGPTPSAAAARRGSGRAAASEQFPQLPNEPLPERRQAGRDAAAAAAAAARRLRVPSPRPEPKSPPGARRAGAPPISTPEDHQAAAAV